MKRYLALAVLFPVLLLSACPVGVMDPEVVTFWGGDLSVPTLGEVSAVSASGVNASFSASVSVVSAEVLVGQGIDGNERIPVTWGEGAETGSILFTLGKPCGIAERAILSGTVRDAKGNTLSFAVPFTAYNDRVPRLRISEVRTDYSKPKVEYIELRALSAGNIGGVEIFNAANGANPVRELPAAEVASGEYIVWHFRSLEEGLVNETGALDASVGVDACATARDFWDTQTKAPFKGTNVIWIRERKGGAILDALLCAEGDKADWPNDAVRSAASEAVKARAWQPGPSVTDAASAADTTATRTLARDPALTDTDTAADWKVCATGKCSPGTVNVPH
jgi:hypothetical protein